MPGGLHSLESPQQHLHGGRDRLEGVEKTNLPVARRIRSEQLRTPIAHMCANIKHDQIAILGIVSKYEFLDQLLAISAHIVRYVQPCGVRKVTADSREAPPAYACHQQTPKARLHERVQREFGLCGRHTLIVD